MINWKLGEDQMEIKTICDSLGIRLISYSPLGLGMLTGKYTPSNLPSGPRSLLFRQVIPGLEPLLISLKEVALKRGKTIPQVAINWCICKGLYKHCWCRFYFSSWMKARQTYPIGGSSYYGKHIHHIQRRRQDHHHLQPTSNNQRRCLGHDLGPRESFTRKHVVIVMDAMKEFSVETLKWVLKNIALETCCTITFLGVKPWLTFVY